jgi:hypothetical protein
MPAARSQRAKDHLDGQGLDAAKKLLVHGVCKAHLLQILQPARYATENCLRLITMGRVTTILERQQIEAVSVTGNSLDLLQRADREITTGSSVVERHP